jgi:hypothetical protein
MLPSYLLAFVVTSVVSEFVMLPWLGLEMGDLMLMERGVAGWTSEIAFTAALLAPAGAGIGYAVAALRSGGRRLALVGLIVNALLALLTLYMFVDAVHMTYDPHGPWLRS